MFKMVWTSVLLVSMLMLGSCVPASNSPLERYPYGNASIADFIAVAEEMSGQDLGEFFNGWLYAPQIPDIPKGLD